MDPDQQQLNLQLEHLATRDQDVAQALQLVGYPSPRKRRAGFSSLLAIIVSQQLSTHAADSIMQRLHELAPGMETAAFLRLPEEKLRSAGLSARKVEYAKGLAEALQSGRLNLEALSKMDDTDATRSITAVRGLGVWSAQIYLMFALGRDDIFPYDDLALQVALQRLKSLEHRPKGKLALELTAHWSPFRTAGSLFLWHYYRGAPA